MQKEFPELEFVHLSGYKLKYGRSKWGTIFKIIFQIPKMLIAINKEKNWLKGFTIRKHLDLIVADNRFGLAHPQIKSVFMTHQLQIKTSLGSRADRFIQILNYRLINRFHECWVPDAAGDINLAGALSHPVALPKIPVTYIGALSRIKSEPASRSHSLLILISGPEPQRSIFEDLILQQLTAHEYSAVVVRGLPGRSTTLNNVAPWLTIFNHLPQQELQQAINVAEVIVSRSGYSTIMDVLPLGKKCILIPTPGQAEQEYLAVSLAKKNLVCTTPQHLFDLPQMVEKAKQLQVPDLAFLKNDSLIDEAIEKVITPV